MKPKPRKKRYKSVSSMVKDISTKRFYKRFKNRKKKVHRHRYTEIGGYKNQLSCLNKTITYIFCKCGKKKP